MDDENERFWVQELDDYSLPYGMDTVAIVDEEQGGVILYCHQDNANVIRNALIAYHTKIPEWQRSLDHVVNQQGDYLGTLDGVIAEMGSW